MKKMQLTLLFFVALTGFWNANAQKNIGIRAGFNFATVKGSDIPDVGSNNGFYVGVYKELPFLVKKVLYIVPELQYSKQGFSSGGNDVTLDYLNVPILAKVYLVKVLSLETGPQFGWKINDSGLGNASTNNFDSAWAVGLSFNLPFGLAISGRYIGSFNEVVKDTNAKNQIAQVGLGFKF